VVLREIAIRDELVLTLRRMAAGGLVLGADDLAGALARAVALEEEAPLLT
jgi:hypothetical protein